MYRSPPWAIALDVNTGTAAPPNGRSASDSPPPFDVTDLPEAGVPGPRMPVLGLIVDFPTGKGKGPDAPKNIGVKSCAGPSTPQPQRPAWRVQHGAVLRVQKRFLSSATRPTSSTSTSSAPGVGLGVSSTHANFPEAAPGTSACGPKFLNPDLRVPTPEWRYPTGTNCADYRPAR